MGRWRNAKSAIKEASNATRRKLEEVADADASTADGVMRSISRAVMHSDSWLATRLLARSALASREVGVEGARALLLDGEGFAARFAEARAAALEASAREAPADGRRGRGQGRALQRMLALWARRPKRLVLGHVDRDGTDGEMAGGRREPQSEAGRFDSLRAHWRVVERRATEESVRRLRAARPTQAWPRLESAGPTLNVVKSVLERAKGSAPGPDGLRYRAWRSAGDDVAASLHSLLLMFIAGEAVPEDFGVALMICLGREAKSRAKALTSDAGLPPPDRWA